jgi:hypothetical protein
VFDLGHAYGIGAVRQSNGKTVSLDEDGHWALWDTANKALIASGTSLAPTSCPSGCRELDMAGNVFAVAQTNAVELRSATDGHLIVSIPADPPTMLPFTGLPPFGFASDASYVWIGSHSDLEAWSASGVKLFSHPGNYFDAVAFATPTEIRVAHVGSTVQTIEYVAVPSGTSTMSSAFAGSFNAWFQDGTAFLASVSSTAVRVYTKDVVQQAISTLPAAFAQWGGSFGGYGSYFWINTLENSLSVYAIAQPTTPLLTVGASNAPVASASLVAVLYADSPVLTLLHLDPGGVTQEQVPIPSPAPALSGFGADASGAWSVGNSNGVVYDRDNLLATKGPLSCGRPFDYDGAQTGLAAVATPGGGVLTFTAGATGLTFSGAIPYDAQRVQMSADGSVIAVHDNQTTDQDLRIFSMPGAVLLKDWSYPINFFGLLWLSLARGGTAIGRVWIDTSVFPQPQYDVVTDITGTTTSFTNKVTWNSSAMTTRIFVSPNGTLAADSDPTGSTARIYKNGALVDVASGEPYGWLDDDRLLLQVAGNMTAVHSVMTTTNVATALVPCTSFTPVDTNHVFCWAGYQSSNNNAIYSFSTSAIVWTGSPRSIPGGLTGLGAGPNATNDAKTATLAGGYVVYGNGSQILVEPYTIPP